MLINPFKNLPPLNPKDDNDDFVPYMFIDNFLSLKEITVIKNIWDEEKKKQAKVGSDILNLNVRKSHVVGIDNNEENKWIYDKLAVGCIITNVKKYNFNISGFQSKLQLMSYEVDDFFEWHMDFGKKNSNRKLSITIQLSGPEDYTGGELQFLHKNITAPKTIGTAIIFPSFIMHRILPITSGCRKSLVGWIAGPTYQ